MTRIGAFWHDLTEGNSLGALWLDFRREARSSFEGSAPAATPSGAELSGFQRVWAFARAMFFRLSPARRVLLLFALLMMVTFHIGTTEGEVQQPQPHLFLGAACLLLLLGLEVADRVALKRDLELARDIQKWLVPGMPPDIPGVEIAFATRPANTVAGDYFDVLPLAAEDGADASVLFVVADVAGKGIPAGLLMACFRTCLRTLADATRDLAALASRLNRSCFADSRSGRHYTTVFLAGYTPSTRSLAYVNAGHNPPLLKTADGRIAQLEIGGLPCGAFPDARYEVGHVAVAPGDLLLIYTDGVCEAVNPDGAEFGLERLCDFVRDADGPASVVQSRLFSALAAFVGRTPQHDDMTTMVVRFTA